MDSIIHAEIFFFVSTIALVVISVGAIIALVYIIKILRNVSTISDKVKAESDEIINDVKMLRTSLKTEGARIRPFVTFIQKFVLRKRRSKKKEEES